MESFKQDLLSRISNIDYETYIKQFWVGLLEGDGTITVSSPGPNHVKVRMFISIKNFKENVLMLLLIKEVLGGTVRIERNFQYVTWVAIKKDLIQTLIGILKEYPLLTSRKQCQLKFAFFAPNTRFVSPFYLSNGINRNTKSRSGPTVKFFSTCCEAAI